MKHLKLLCLLLFAIFSLPETSSAATATLLVGQTYQTEISATGYHYLSIESVSSTNPSVSVTKTGLVVKATVNAFFSGEATVTARLRYQLYAGQNYQYRNQEFTISCNDTQIAISPSNLTLKKDETTQIGFSFNRPIQVSPSITWSSSDNSIVSVSSTGLITAKNEGTAIVYAHSNLGSNTSSCNVTVTDNKGNSSEEKPIGSGDVSWYNASEKEFHISNAEEFLGFRTLVSQGKSFSEKIVYLDNDLDLSSINWNSPIGATEKKPFNGTFDAQYHNINYNINHITNTEEYEQYYGLFGYVKGSIKNLSTSGSIDFTASSKVGYVFIGGIVGKLTSGSINNCQNKISIEYRCMNTYTSYVYIGGIIGYTTGHITGCINTGIIKDNTNRAGNTAYNNHFLGGLCGVLYGGTIEQCLNLAEVKCGPDNVSEYNTQNNITTIIGGLAGSMTAYSRCRYSGNIGNILASTSKVNLGGIAGTIQKECVVYDCYVACSKLGDPIDKTTNSSSIGTIGGSTNASSSYMYNYVASDMIEYGLKNGLSADRKFSISQMKTLDFVTELNKYTEPKIKFIGGDGLFPSCAISVFTPDYFQTTISNITCTSAIAESNAYEIFGNKLKLCGFLIRQDDGKEQYRQCQPNSYKLEINNLIPNRLYYIRWFAKDLNGNEYYGYETNFTTRNSNPITLPAKASVFSANLKAEYYITNVSQLGFYIIEKGSETVGQYYWDTITDSASSFSLNATNLKGNSEYLYKAVIVIDGINYEGDELSFTTKLISTSSPSESNNNTISLNGEIGIHISNAWFEFRAESWPSVIESERVNISNFDIGFVSAQSPTLQINETYKYRLVAENNEEVIYGDWYEFVFEGETGIEEYYPDSIDESIPVFVYNLSGQLVYNGIWKNNNLIHGIYILKQGHNTYKIRL